MSQCPNCNMNIKSGVKYCPGCGCQLSDYSDDFEFVDDFSFTKTTDFSDDFNYSDTNDGTDNDFGYDDSLNIDDFDNKEFDDGFITDDFDNKEFENDFSLDDFDSKGFDDAFVSDDFEHDLTIDKTNKKDNNSNYTTEDAQLKNKSRDIFDTGLIEDDFSFDEIDGSKQSNMKAEIDNSLSDNDFDFIAGDFEGDFEKNISSSEENGMDFFDELPIDENDSFNNDNQEVSTTIDTVDNSDEDFYFDDFDFGDDLNNNKIESSNANGGSDLFNNPDVSDDELSDNLDISDEKHYVDVIDNTNDTDFSDDFKDFLSDEFEDTLSIDENLNQDSSPATTDNPSDNTVSLQTEDNTVSLQTEENDDFIGDDFDFTSDYQDIKADEDVIISNMDNDSVEDNLHINKNFDDRKMDDEVFIESDFSFESQLDDDSSFDDDNVNDEYDLNDISSDDIFENNAQINNDDYEYMDEFDIDDNPMSKYIEEETYDDEYSSITDILMANKTLILIIIIIILVLILIIEHI